MATQHDLLSLKSEVSEKVFSATLRYGERRARPSLRCLRGGCVGPTSTRHMPPPPSFSPHLMSAELCDIPQTRMAHYHHAFLSPLSRPPPPLPLPQLSMYQYAVFARRQYVGAGRKQSPKFVVFLFSSFRRHVRQGRIQQGRERIIACRQNWHRVVPLSRT